MKLPFKWQPLPLLLALVFHLPVKAKPLRDIILITSQQNSTKAEQKGELIQQVLTRKMGVPRRLIRHHLRSKSCTTEKDAVLHICVDGAGKMHFLTINRTAIRAFEVFYQESKPLQKRFEKLHANEN
jgi:hypothetical protein